MQEIIYQTIQDCGEVVKLVKPRKLTELDLPEKVIQKNNFSMSQFIVLKDGEINVQELKEILLIRLIQKFNSLDFPGINLKYQLYDGNLSPPLMIDEIHDYGKYVHIDVIWTNERYSQLVTARLRSKIQTFNLPSNTISDPDFK